jgi:hypothetical protein
MLSRKKEFGEQIKKIDLSGFKLLPSAKPPFFHGSTVRRNSQYLWSKKIRPAVLEQHEKKCSICGWIPENDTELKNLHLHEIESYDFENKVCHLIGIELICMKCHSLQHIGRTKSVLTKEQWEELMQHFVKVNGCSPETDFDLILAKALKREGKFQAQSKMSFGMKLEDILKSAEKPVRFTINPQIPFAEELEAHLMKKGLLYKGEDKKVDKGIETP